MVTRQIRINGGVQGVGFREALREQAERAGLTGWVRNRSDGSVEAVLQGEASGIEEVVAWARRGPAAASVRGLTQGAPDPTFDRPYARFERWPTV
jgi:acylphosphatase